MEGLDHNWVRPAGAARILFAPAAGEYTFTVTAANSDGVWNTEA